MRKGEGMSGRGSGGGCGDTVSASRTEQGEWATIMEKSVERSCRCRERSSAFSLWKGWGKGGTSGRRPRQ